MKQYVFLFFGLLCFSALAQTQLDINDSTEAAFNKADKELNKVYQNILSEYKSDSEFIKNLKASQRIWIKFRDTEVLMKYPERENGYYGSIHSMCVSDYREKLTKDRIKTLKVWLEGVEEGNPCSGTVKTK